jgi:predicted transcriptional regulator
VGDVAGRPKTSPKDAKVRLAKTLLADKSLEVDDICETLKISRSTLYRYANL